MAICPTECALWALLAHGRLTEVDPLRALSEVVDVGPSSGGVSELAVDRAGLPIAGGVEVPGLAASELRSLVSTTQESVPTPQERSRPAVSRPLAMSQQRLWIGRRIARIL